MESYFTLKGFNSFNDVDITNEVQQSIIMFFDFGFLDKGAFTNVRLTSSDIHSNDQSKLRRVNDPNFSNGRVWETFKHGLVWESGLSYPVAPISISGVYVNGAFKTPSDSTYAHYVDYSRGRVVFDNPISLNATVKMEYSYKNITFDKVSVYPEVSELQLDSNNFGSFYNSPNSGDWSTLLRQQTPLVAVEVSPRIECEPVELGNGTHYVYTDVLMHVVDSNDVMVSKLVSFLTLQKEKVIYRADMTLIGASGMFPLDSRGAKVNDPKTYRDYINGGYRHPKIYFDDVVGSNSTLYSDKVYHGVVKFTTETISTI